MIWCNLRVKTASAVVVVPKGEKERKKKTIQNFYRENIDAMTWL